MMEGSSTTAFTLEKYLVVPGLMLTTVLATTLLATRIEDRLSSPGFADYVITNRPAVGIVVQILSHILGMFHVSAIRTVINLSSRIYLLRRSFSLEWISFLNALCGPRLDWSLRWPQRLMLVTYLALAMIPAALWAGALTPVVSEKHIPQTISLPGYNNTSLLAHIPYHSYLRDIYNVNTPKGLFSYAPEFDMQGSMLGQAADASPRIGDFTNHTKLDKTNYVYQGRSYGVGSSVGLGDDTLLASTQGYEYFETGFQANTSCIYNVTADFGLSQNILAGDGLLLEIFEAVGTDPFGGGINFATMAFSPEGVVAVYTATKGNQHVLMITTGTNGTGYYSPLENVQCGITFTPTNYSVSVDTTHRLITVSEQNAVAWPEYGGLFVNGSVLAIWTMGQSLATTLYVSIIGQSLMYNIANVEANSGPSNSSTLKGISDAVNSILDNILLEYGSAQLMVAKERVTTQVSTSVRAVAFGSVAYVIPLFILNILICLVYIMEMLRTKRWRNLTNFDFMVVRSLMVGTSIGGTALADRAQKLHDAHSQAWKSDDDARLLGEIQLRLHKRPSMDVAIILANEDVPPAEDSSVTTHRNQSQSDADSFLLQELSFQKVPTHDTPAVEFDSPLLDPFRNHEISGRD